MQAMLVIPFLRLGENILSVPHQDVNPHAISNKKPSPSRQQLSDTPAAVCRQWNDEQAALRLVAALAKLSSVARAVALIG